ncbi:MAG: PQQ-binding-like beta-propeller repeat protein [Candidatus Zixiibacteriota bacterium]|nr:MAG: PQQ-binding-like beta-propeller repeat protein [candidate division Zixibacteria bacterium]
MTRRIPISRLRIVFGLAFLAVACRAGHQDKTELRKPLAGEESNQMQSSYIQPHANPQLNSFLDYDVTAKGKKAWKFRYNDTSIPSNAQYLHLIDETRAVVDFERVFFAVNLGDRRTLGFRDKSVNTFIRLDEEGGFWFFSSHLLLRVSFEAFDDESRTGDLVPGLGDHSDLLCFAPREEDFIAGMLLLPYPKRHDISFALIKMKYGALLQEWKRAIPDTVIRTPVYGNGRTVLAYRDTISLVRSNNLVDRAVTGSFLPLSCSVGPDNLLYSVLQTEKGYVLAAHYDSGEPVWEIPTAVTAPVQPPVVGKHGLVFLVGAGQLEVVQDGEILWNAELKSDTPSATVTSNDRLLVADGDRIICFSAEGKTVWEYVDEEGDHFRTPPVVGPSGSVFVASDGAITRID